MSLQATDMLTRLRWEILWTKSGILVYLYKALTEVGANLNAVGGPDKDTPLIVAVYYGYKAVVEVLLEAGVEVNSRDAYGKTALYWARWTNYRRIAKLLTKYGAVL